MEAGSATLLATNRTVPDGWRKVTPSVIETNRAAEEGTLLGHDRTRCIVAVKRVGVQIGLKAADLLLLDTLAAFTQPQDWQSGQRPVVWASNAYLMERTGFSLSTLKRHARRLAETGVLSFRDSPNGKRWGRRDGEGTIVEAYGFDLSPLSARVEEFEALAQANAEERALCQRLRRQITIARRSIRARLEAASSHHRLASLIAAFEDLLERLPGPRAASAILAGLLQQFVDLLGCLDSMMAPPNTVEPTGNQTKMNPREVNSDPHIPFTKQPDSVACNPLEKGKRENRRPSMDPSPQTDTRRNDGVGIDLGTILQACPEFVSWSRNFDDSIESWRDFERVAGQLRPMVGISEDAWTTAQAQMGRSMAAASMALVFEKVHAGEVTSPGGYLRGMAAKAGAGELHLARSFFGRLSGLAA